MRDLTKPIALWAVPRSVSTAFERIFVERGDFKVFHEPFSRTYYYSTERRSERFAGEEPKGEYRHEKVLAEILTPHESPVFFKDMAYHAAGFLDREFVGNFTNTFIIREPSQVLSSLHRMWPDFTFEEAGYEHLHRLFRHAIDLGQEPAIVEARDLSKDTEDTVATYCDALDIPHHPEALSWEPREVPEWKMWDEWHTDAQESTGIEELPPDPVPLPEELQETYERCLPYYEELSAHRLRPSRKE